ncbi:MAG TPA: hypothetical protein VD886_16005 [Herpetosiphonaceae bacterium]|nr:hypothetical protein [Herpetosiphonaceae bacterium]
MPDPDAAGGVPPHLKRFVREHIPSLHQLEILLWVATPPLRTWRADTIALQLYLPLDLVEERLADLVRRGLLRADESASPTSYMAAATDIALIDQLAIYYRQNRITLTTFIFSQPSDTVHSFADTRSPRKPAQAIPDPPGHEDV